VHTGGRRTPTTRGRSRQPTATSTAVDYLFTVYSATVEYTSFSHNIVAGRVFDHRPTIASFILKIIRCVQSMLHLA
jgi:hypothetical protein